MKFLVLKKLVGKHMSDSIADFLTRIRNALAVRKAEVVMPYSNLRHNLAKVLVAAGYLKDAQRVAEGHGILRLELNYTSDGRPALQHLRRISTPGRRVYVGYDKLRPVCSGRGLAIISTSKGLITDQEAKQQRLGGELMCEVW